MKKFILMFALMVSAVMSANAQIATQNRKFFDNVSIGIVGGVSTPLDFNSMFPINPMVGLKIQKDFTPIFGMQIEGLAVLNDNHFSNLKTTVKATNVGLNGLINLSNALYGYKGAPRTFEVSLVGGLGWLHAWNTSENYLTSKTGLDLAFNIGSKKAHSLILTPAVFWNLNKFGDIKFDKKGAQLALTASYVYHFATSNGTHHFKTYDIGAMNDEINHLRGQLEECEKREPKVIEKVVEKVIIKEVPTTAAVAEKEWTVAFETSKSTLSTEAKATLDKIGNDAIVNVLGEASPEGSKAFNKRLAAKRANVVKDYLTNRGVNVKNTASKTNAKKAAIVTAAQ